MEIRDHSGIPILVNTKQPNEEFSQLQSENERLSAEIERLKKEPSKVWAFLYNDNIHESASATMSLHLSKEAAEKAMNTHIDNAKAEHDQYSISCKNSGWPPPEFGEHEKWHVRELEILP